MKGILAFSTIILGIVALLTALKRYQVKIQENIDRMMEESKELKILKQ